MTPSATFSEDLAAEEKTRLALKIEEATKKAGGEAEARKQIFPDINNSGGDPQKITDLTYEQLSSYHAQHYHPSNAKLFTYGDMPLADHLQEVDARLKVFDRIAEDTLVHSPIDLSNGPQEHIVEGPLDPLVAADKQFKTSVSWVMGETSDVVETFSLSLLSTLLMDGYGSPLYRGLIESGLGTDFSPNAGYDGSGKLGIYSVGLTGVQEADLLVEQGKSNTEDLSCLPTVHVKDIPRSKEPVVVRDDSNNGVKTQWHEAPTNGLTYFRAVNTIENLPDELRELIPLFTDSIMRLGTKDTSMEQLEDLMKLKTGGMSVGYHSTPSPTDFQHATEGFIFAGMALDRNVPAMFDLLLNFTDMVMATVALEQYAPPTINYDRSYHTILKTKQQYADHAPANNAVITPKQLIGEALRRRVESIDTESCGAGEEDTFFVADLGEVYRQHMRWKLNLPRVKPFYAVKCNPDPRVIELLAALGTGFDCASKWEIDQILNMGLTPERIIYAQPCKTNSYLRYVKTQGVKQMTFDNADELYKIAKLYPGAELFLRIMTDDESSLCRFSMKFGASKEIAGELLALAKDLGLNVVGVSFHVGSGASDPMAFYKAVHDSYLVFEQGRAFGFNMKTLDIGGGFCDDSFEDMAAVLRGALDEYFPPSSNVNIMAE
ncbi:hypothetical protein BN1723_017006, partial [Verticillium longisporum]